MKTNIPSIQQTSPDSKTCKVDDTPQPTPNQHDLNLPDWGPYTKIYHGISHIPDIKRGLRFDLSVFPGFYRRQVMVPNAKWESGYHPWEAAADLGYYSHRYELEWKDAVYCDVSFSTLNEKARLIRAEFVNNTASEQNLVLNYMAAMNFPPVRTYSDEPVLPAKVILPEGALWLDALDYQDLCFARPRPTDNLVYDAMLRGEVRGHGFVNGSGVGAGFGEDDGDHVYYCLTLPQTLQDAVLLVRYRLAGNVPLCVAFEGLPFEQEVELPPCAEFTLQRVPLGNLSAGQHAFKMISRGGAALELDGFVIAPTAQEHQVRFELVAWSYAPRIQRGKHPNSLILKYAEVDNVYGLWWQFDSFQVREFYTSELDIFFRHRVHEHVAEVMRGKGDGHFTNAFLRPITVAPHSSLSIYGVVCQGSQPEVEQFLNQLAGEPGTGKAPTPDLEQVYASARQKAVNLAATLAGKPYLFSQERMAATLLTNVVYPVYVKRTYIRHNTPGKWWDCLYTWDSGFTGLGLLELDLQRAVDCLNAYMTEPGDSQTAFIHHGSPVPVQFYLFLELWNRTQSRTLLEYFYPRLQQYYRFMAGRLGSSTTRTLPSNLLKTWDYFYNSGGWDDYPPQVYVHAHKLEKSTTPVVTTAHVIRAAKILRMMAQALGSTADIAEYEQDIASFSQALQKFAWDEASGYFGYVQHDEQGKPLGILRHTGGQNFDMGLDGASPLVAGICTPTQEKSIVERLMSGKHLWTRIGLSTVDQSAAYYRKDGYWNGAVWMPHQWFFWKALLNLGYAGEAQRIAQTALELWKNEVETSYNCFEHFIVQSGRGAGWHQFGGLSTPVLAWFGAYHRPGRLTCGLDIWVEQQQWGDYNRSLQADLRFAGTLPAQSTIIVSMEPGQQYQVKWNGQAIAFEQPYLGTLQIKITFDQAESHLTVTAT